MSEKKNVGRSEGMDRYWGHLPGQLRQIQGIIHGNLKGDAKDREGV